MFDDIKDLTGHKKEQIGKITEKYIGLTKIKPSEIRDGEQAVSIYLTKLRRVLTNEDLALMYSISLSNPKNCVKKVRN